MIVAALQQSQSSSWSGLLPRPDDFARYPVHVQDRMLQWNDAWTVDESNRQDKLVDAEIRQAERGPTRAMVLGLLCFVAAIVFFALGNNVAGVAFLAAPVLGFAAQFLLIRVSSRSSRGDKDNSSEQRSADDDE